MEVMRFWSINTLIKRTLYVDNHQGFDIILVKYRCIENFGICWSCEKGGGIKLINR